MLMDSTGLSYPCNKYNRPKEREGYLRNKEKIGEVDDL